MQKSAFCKIQARLKITSGRQSILLSLPHLAWELILNNEIELLSGMTPYERGDFLQWRASSYSSISEIQVQEVV